ncbi:hypothetical protein [Bdellovibrio sp. NC01]|uniref:hypothetical protein n=1 Tax=Bdellovibrio sp. NC01 TaxID=2220073 RepID=UPI00115A868D|nr:hypothetical protein [Bdellovibrio sp. NC01]QDK39072.1 hypothetical protein DOE51_16495 [Bdellovibrio sp. NC01]
MNKLIVSLATLVLSVSVAHAKSKSTGTVVAKNSPTAERSYASSENFFSGGSGSQHEFTTILTRGVLTSEKACKDCDTATVIDVGASYSHYLKDGFQVGGEARIQLLPKEVTGGDSATLIDLLAVGTYNFQSDLKNAFFAKLGLGLYGLLKDNRDGGEEKFGFFLSAGKRFALWNNVSYSPEFRLVKKGDIDMGIEVAVLNFSVIW